MSAVARPNSPLLDLAILTHDEDADGHKKIALAEASQALARINETTKVFGLKSDAYQDGHAVVINIDPESLETLDKNESLDRFLLQRVQITADLLHSILKHKNLTYIALMDGALFGDALVTQFCTGLENNETIKTVNLLSNDFSTSQLETIIKVIKTTKVEKFLIAGSDCNSSSFKLLADSLPDNPDLKEISLCPRHVDATYAENVRKIIRDNKSLASIKLYPVAEGTDPSYLLTKTDLTNILEDAESNPSIQEVWLMASLIEPDARGEFAVAWSQQMDFICAAHANASSVEK